MEILHWASAHKIHIRVTCEQTVVFAYGEGTWPLSDLHTVGLLGRIQFPGADGSRIIERSGKTRAEAFAGLCVTISGASVWHNGAWLVIPQLTYAPE